MKLAKSLVPSDDVRYGIEQEIYLAHCRNIASILSAAGKKGGQELVDQYLEAVNTDTEE